MGKAGSWRRVWHGVGTQCMGGVTAAFCRESPLERAVRSGYKGKGLTEEAQPRGRGDTGMKAFVCFLNKLLH